MSAEEKDMLRRIAEGMNTLPESERNTSSVLQRGPWPPASGPRMTNRSRTARERS